MTVANSLNKHTYIGNGVTTSFPYTFKIFKSTDIQVILTDIETGDETLLSTNYTVNTNTNTVTYPVSGTPLTSATKITLNRSVPITQETALPNGGPYLARVIEAAFDKDIIIDQQLQAQIDRTLKFAITVPDDFNRSLPAPVALKALRINSDATAFEYTTDPEIASNQAAASAAAALASENNSATSEGNAATSETNAAVSASTIGGFLDYTAVAKVADIILKDPFVDPRAYGAVGDGIADDTTSIQAAINTGKNIFIPPQCTFLTSDLSFNTQGQQIFGGGTLKAKTGTATLLTCNADNVKIDNVKINANGCTYGIKLKEANQKVKDCYFTGSVGNYVLVGGAIHARVDFNTFNGTGASMVSPVVFDNSSSFSCCGNTFIDTSGFGIQTRFSSEGVITDNIFYMPMHTTTAIATDGQTVFNLVLDDTCVRFGTLKNGARATSTVVVSGVNCTVTMSVACNAGDTIKLIGFKALENVNINSNSYDITIAQNIINGSGDSGIVLCADYHNGVLDPTNVTSSDFPARITLKGNTIKNALYAGMAETHSIDNVSYIGNNVLDCAWGLGATSSVYDCGIVVTGGQTSLIGNIITCSSAGVMKYGIVTRPSINIVKNDYTVKISGNIFSGLTQNIMPFADSDGSRRFYGALAVDAPMITYPMVDLDAAWTNFPVNASYWTGAFSGGTGLTRDTAVIAGGVASIKTLASQYADLSLTGIGMLDNSIITLTFRAKAAASSSGYVSAYYSFPGDDSSPPATVTITDTSWKTYSVQMITGAVSSFFYRIGGTSGNINIQHLRMQIQYL